MLKYHVGRDETRKLHDRYVAGETLAQIAGTVGITRQALSLRFKRHSMKCRPCYGTRKVDEQAVLSGRRKGQSVKEIAGGLGCSIGTVYWWIRKLKGEGIHV